MTVVLVVEALRFPKTPKIALIPLQKISPSLSATVVDSSPLPHLAQRKQPLCHDLGEKDIVKSWTENVHCDKIEEIFLTLPPPITFSAA